METTTALLLDLIAEQLAAEGKVFNPAYATVVTAEPVEQSSGQWVLQGTLHVEAGTQTATMAFSVPMVSLTIYQSTLLNTDVIVNLPAGHTLESLAAALDSGVEPSEWLRWDDLTVVHSGDILFIRPKAGVPVQLYHGEIRLTIADPFANELARVSLINNLPLLAPDNLNYLTAVNAYNGFAEQVRLDGQSWYSWRLEDVVAAPIMVAVAQYATPGTVMGVVAIPTTADVADSVRASFHSQIDATVALVVYQSVEDMLEIFRKECVLVAGRYSVIDLNQIPATAVVRIEAVAAQSYLMTMQVVPSVVHGMYPQYEEYAPIYVAEPKVGYRFEGMRQLTTAQYMPFEKSVTMAGDVTLEADDNDRNRTWHLQSLGTLEDTQLLELSVAGDEVVATFEFHQTRTEIRLSRQSADTFHYIARITDGATLSLQIGARIASTPIAMPVGQAWRSYPAYYDIGGFDTAPFVMRKHFVTTAQNFAVLDQLWAETRWG